MYKFPLGMRLTFFDSDTNYKIKACNLFGCHWAKIQKQLNPGTSSSLCVQAYQKSFLRRYFLTIPGRFREQGFLLAVLQR